jgi:AraC-like DNA-binding protein
MRFPLRAGVFYTGGLCGIYDFDRDTKPAHFHYIHSGEVELVGADGARQAVIGPSIILMPRADSHGLVADDRVEAVCATVRFGTGAISPVVGALPAVLVARPTGGPMLGPLCELLSMEARATDAGRQVALNRLCELTVVAILRSCLDNKLASGGVLAGLSDPRLSRALLRVHEQPCREWSLDDLAILAGMSRARFASRFRCVVGTTPGEHLTACRVAQAQELLRQGLKLKQVADQVGYGSPRALSRAFTRVVGVGPLGWMTRGTAAAAPAPAPAPAKVAA